MNESQSLSESSAASPLVYTAAVARIHELTANKHDAFSRCANDRVQELNEENSGPLVSLHESL